MSKDGSVNGKMWGDFYYPDRPMNRSIKGYKLFYVGEFSAHKMSSERVESEIEKTWGEKAHYSYEYQNGRGWVVMVYDYIRNARKLSFD